MGAKVKPKAQVGFLLSDKVSPLNPKQKSKLKSELHTGKVKVSKQEHLVNSGGNKSRAKKSY